MKVHRWFAQRSVDWMMARAGIPTASEFDNLVTPDFKIREGGMPKSYLAKKLAERWLGGPLAGFNVFDVEQGNILEEEALPYYGLTYGEEIEQVGFITTDDGRIGCSPDGLFKDGSGIEIKCPVAHTQVGYLMSGELPKEYVAQVHGGMFVANAPHWTFFSYARRFPPLKIHIERDDAIQEVLAEALALFLTRLESGYEQLCDLNGGPPRRLVTNVQPKSEFQSDPNDIPLP